MNKNNQLDIRNYKSADAPQLVKLYSDLGYPSDEKSIKNRLEKLLEHTDYHMLVLLQENKVIGFCGFCKMYMFESDQSYLRILAFVIDSDYRGKKYGSKLLQAIEEIAIEMNAPIVTFNSGNRSERDIAHHFYVNNGYLVKSSGFIKKLL